MTQHGKTVALFFFLMFSPILILAQGLGSLTIIGLQVDQPAWVKHTWLEKDVQVPAGTTDVTVCFHLQLHYIYGSTAVIVSMDRGLEFVAQEQTYGISVNKKFVTALKQPRAWQWTHVCVVLGNSPALLLDGNPVTTEVQGASSQIYLSGTYKVTLGMPADLYDMKTQTSFGGYATLPRVYTRRLMQSEVTVLATCGSLASSAALVTGPWKVMMDKPCSGVTPGEVGTLEQTNNTFSEYTPNNTIPESSTLMIRDEPWSELCSNAPSHSFMIIDGALDYEGAVKYCSAYKGTLPMVSESGIVQAAQKLLLNNPQLYLSFWVKDSTQACSLMMLREGWLTPHVVNGKCGDSSKYLACKVATNMTLQLRHNRKTDMDTTFYLVPDVTQPRFLSLAGRQIVSMGPAYLSLSLLNSEGQLLATAMGKGGQPIGRYAWNYVGSNTTKVMILTSCTLEEFTCSDGSCLPLSSRCDGTSDCSDGSDESCTLLQPLPESYRSNRPHIPKTPLRLFASLLRIHDVDVNNNVMAACMQLKTEWSDKRVTTSQLSHNPSDNTLDTSALWEPQYRLTNAEFFDAMGYINREDTDVALRVHRNGQGTVDVVEGVEGYMYSASENSFIERIEGFKASYICNFLLDVYPFDVHECHMNYAIHHTGEFKAYFNVSDIRVKSDPSVLNLFTSSQMCYTYSRDVHNLTTQLSFRIMLTRQYGAYVFTTFVPCAVLSVIGTCTQFFGYTNFSDRIMVTLSCLIVVAALFSQVAVTAPVSASPKCIDIYFFYAMIRQFIIFLHHSALFLVQNYFNSREELRKAEGVSKNTAVQVIKPPSSPNTQDENQESIPEPVAYRKPKIYLPVTPWLGQSEDLPEKREEDNTTWYRPGDRLFNVVSIAAGFLLDFICAIVFGYWVYSFRRDVMDKFDECSQM